MAGYGLVTVLSRRPPNSPSGCKAYSSRVQQREQPGTTTTNLQQRSACASAYSAALSEWSRGQIDWLNRREDPDSEMTLAARVESYRLKDVARTALSQVQLVASEQELVTGANRASELTRSVHTPRMEPTWTYEAT